MNDVRVWTYVLMLRVSSVRVRYSVVTMTSVTGGGVYTEVTVYGTLSMVVDVIIVGMTVVIHDVRVVPGPTLG